MKNLLKLEGAQPMHKNEQQSINGGWDTNGGPCGATGGKIIHCDPTCHCGGVRFGNCCWACY